MNHSRLDLAGLVGAVLVALWLLPGAPGEGPRPLDCTHAAQMVVDGEARLLCGAQLEREGLSDGDRVGAGGVKRMAPELIEALALPVDVNRASQPELETLPGIGPTLAGRIVAGRPYASLEALDAVKGIGPRKLEGLRARARFTGLRSR